MSGRPVTVPATTEAAVASGKLREGEKMPSWEDGTMGGRERKLLRLGT